MQRPCASRFSARCLNVCLCGKRATTSAARNVSEAVSSQPKFCDYQGGVRLIYGLDVELVGPSTISTTYGGASTFCWARVSTFLRCDRPNTRMLQIGRR